MAGHWIKVALEVKETTHLTQVDISQSVEDILRGICQQNDIPYERGRLALKVRDFCDILGTEYVTDDNKNELKHGRHLKLSKSPRKRAAALIDALHKSNTFESSVKTLKSIAVASKDSVMLNQLHRQNALQHLRVYASVRNLSDDEYHSMYKVFRQFLLRGYVNSLCEEEVNHLIDAITCENKITRRTLILAFDILIILRKNGKLYWPGNLLRKLSPYLRLYQQVKLQEKSLQFINHLYFHSRDDEERLAIFNFIKSSIMITYINKYVIREGLSNAIKHQLYLYQRIIMGKYAKQMEAIDLNEDNVLENVSYVICNIALVNQMRGDVTLSAESPQKQADNRTDKAHRILNTLRLSLTPAGRQRVSSSAADAFHDSENEFILNKIEAREGGSRSPSADSIDAFLQDDKLLSNEEQERKSEWKESSGKVPVLVRDNLYYFILNDYKAFQNVLLIHNNELKSVLRTSIGICRVLCSILEISEKGTCEKGGGGQFIPLCFLYYDYFMERMFCIALQLYHCTRREMGVTVDSPEHPVVLKMVEDQLRMALKWEPLEFVELETRLKALTVEEVMEKRERMVKEEINRQLTKHSAFVELRDIITPRIMNLIWEKRIGFMERGEHVQQFDSKGQKIPGKTWFIHVSKTRDKLLIEECRAWTGDECTGEHKPVEIIAISSITNVEYGNKSNFHKEVYFNLCNERDMFFRTGNKQIEPQLQFPISLKSDKLVYVDFCAGTEVNMYYWVDGLRFLIGENMNSKYTQEELDYLVDVELMEHLANLEGIKIPDKPPLIPPPPTDYHFLTH